MPHSLEQEIGYYHTRCRQLPYSRPILARGWDCHGLPPELEAETQLGINHKNDVEAMGVGKFYRPPRSLLFDSLASNLGR